MNKNDKGINELLDVLKAHPELVRELIFDPKSITRLLRSKSARQLVRGGGVGEFLTYMGKPQDGHAISVCYGGTKALCAKGTALCFGNTAACYGGTTTQPPR